MNTDTADILNTYAGTVRFRLRHHLRLLRTADREYQADVADWYENGEGAPAEWVTEVDDEGNERSYNNGGRGYAYPHCIHGTSRWTDYDNICGPCEDGMPNREIALMRAQDDVLTFVRRVDYIGAAPETLPRDLQESLMEWALKSFD